MTAQTKRSARKQLGRIHFVGIGGIGMSGIAEVFHNQGYSISGSDSKESEQTRRLKKLGILIHSEHRAENIEGAKVVVVSSAISAKNPEVVSARELRIPVIPRAEMLGELMRGKTGISVAGTHGKTTSTSMLAAIFTKADLDPTIVVGGRVNSLGTNAKLGTGSYVIAEADESDGSFLHLPATYGVITNIDSDHLDFYQNIEAIDKAFSDFVSKIPFYGCVAVCGEDPGVNRGIQSWSKPVITYGLTSQWDYYVDEIKQSGRGWTFNVFHKNHLNQLHVCLGKIELHVPGRHNVLNALGCIALANHIEIAFPFIQKALSEFTGVKRRFEVKWENREKQIILIDDYGHHPTEIEATLAAAKNIWDGRIISIFQPHRYSRTLHSKDGFRSAFKDSDLTFITDVYAAGEEPIRGVSGKFLAKEILKSARSNQKVFHVENIEKAKKLVIRESQPGDLILCLGAGSITQLADQMVDNLQEKFNKKIGIRVNQ